MNRNSCPSAAAKTSSSGPGSAGAPATHLHDSIDRFVVAERIMVGESQSLGARGDRVVDRPLRGRVAPARLLRILAPATRNAIRPDNSNLKK